MTSSASFMVGPHLGGLLDALAAARRKVADPTLSAIAASEASMEVRALAASLVDSDFHSLTIGDLVMRVGDHRDPVPPGSHAEGTDIPPPDDLMVIGYSAGGDTFSVSRTRGGFDAPVYCIEHGATWYRSLHADSIDEFLRMMIADAEDRGASVDIAPRSQ